MHQNQSGIYTTNNLSSHASLLLSASPTIITSPLQNNTNNPQSSPLISQTIPARRQPSAQSLAASNLDNNDSHLNIDSPSISTVDEGYINFKKPQNEMFKKLDGKIQRIVAAHSNLNKLYALNDFSSLGVGPKRPFELPPQLPPPPPWVPRVTAEYGNQWNDDSINPLSTIDDRSNSDTDQSRQKSSMSRTSTPMKPVKGRQLTISPSVKSGPLTIDSAITKLHQRRQQQQVTPKPSVNLNQVLRGPASSSSSPSTNNSSPTITPAQFSLLAQKIKETLETECASKNQGGSLSGEDKKKFQEDLIALLKEGITAVTKNAKFRFNTTNNSPPRPKTSDQRSLLLKSSPQTLFNTIRRETSLLLNKREQHGTRSSLSLLSDQQNTNRNVHESVTITNRQSNNNRPQTIKIVVPPTEYFCSNSDSNDSPRNQLESLSDSSQQTPQLTYQVIKSKIRSFQEFNQICLGKSHKFPHGLGGINPGLKRKKSPQKSLDKIVDRLQAKWSPSPTNSESPAPITQKMTSLQQQIIYSSASLLQSSRGSSTMSAPTPIPVFRPPLSAATKSGYFYASSAGASRIVNLKSKKSKRSHLLGLKLGNYLERECPQPNTEKITIEQFAKCLNLVRSNDASLQRHQEQLLQAESKWRMPISNRPMRLRRLRGERMHMPVSASYRATRKVGLQ